MTVTPCPDHATHFGNWLKGLKANKKAIFTAASLAAKATDFLAGLQAVQAEAVPERPSLPSTAPSDFSAVL